MSTSTAKLGAWRAEQQVRFIKHLRARLAAVTDGDEEAIRDTIEGEVDLDPILNKLLASRHEALARAKGLKEYAEKVMEAVQASTAYADRIEGIIYEGLEAAGVTSWQGLLGSCSIVPGGKSVNVLEESKVPFEFWKPVLDKAAVRKQLLEGKPVPGAELKHGDPVLRITVPRGKAKKGTVAEEESASA